MNHPRAGQPAQPDDLVDVDALWSTRTTTAMPDPTNPDAAGRVRHVRAPRVEPRTAFNEAHIVATTPGDRASTARGQGIDGPLFIGRDTHAPVRAGVAVRARGARRQRRRRCSSTRATATRPTPAVSHAILAAQPRQGADRGAGSPTASSSPRRTTRPRDGGFKYNPPHGGPADTDATGWIADRANELLARRAGGRAPRSRSTRRSRRRTGTYDFLGRYVDDLPNVVDLDGDPRRPACGSAPTRWAAPRVAYWGAIGEQLRPRPDRGEPDGRPDVARS